MNAPLRSQRQRRTSLTRMADLDARTAATSAEGAIGELLRHSYHRTTPEVLFGIL